MEERLDLSVLTWNVLAQCYAGAHVPSHLRSSEFKCSNRRNQIGKTLKQCRATVVCLQEVDDVETYWQGKWGQLGYQSRFDKRPKKREGCAMLWKRSVELKKFEKVKLDDIAMDFGVVDHPKNLERGNVLQLAHFWWPEGRCDVVVANTHLFWNPVATDVKILQAFAVCHHLSRFLNVCGLPVETTPVCLCGDFNSLPKSAVVTLVTSGTLPMTHREFVQFIAKQYPQFGEAAPLSIPFAMHSVFSPPTHFTNYTDHFKGVIDYIFIRNVDFASGVVVVPSDPAQYVLDESEDFEALPPENDAARPKVPSRFPLLPSYEWPSDHLALLARLSIARGVRKSSTELKK